MSRFVWYDLMTPDVEAAKAFYRSVFGWSYSPQAPAYTVCNVSNTGVGGMMETPEHLKGMPPFWSGYIYTPNVDEACAKIKTLGGAIHREPWDIPDIIRMAVVGDPGGAFFDIMHPIAREEMARLAPGTAGTMGWNELHAGDLNLAWDFYHAMFGWEKHEAVDMGPIGTYQTFGLGGVSFGGMMKKHPNIPQPCWQYYWNVDGIDGAVARITAGGGKVLMGPHQVPGGSWIINAMDPQGGAFAATSAKK